MRSGLAAVVFGLALFVAGPAAAVLPDGLFADECVVDSDCVAGQSCVLHSWETCYGDPDDGGVEEEGECVEESARLCSLKECASDLDCAGNTSCVVVYEEDCSEGDPREPLPPREGVRDGGFPCEPEVVSFCLPPFLSPCNADADCGPGFVCEPDYDCEEPAPRTSGEPGEPLDGDEGCEPTYPGFCDLVQVPCDDSTQCGAGLVCEDLTELMCNEEWGSGGSGEEPVPGSDGDGGTGPDGDGGDEWSEPICEEAWFCLPPDVLAWVKAIGLSGAYAGSDGAYEENLQGRASDSGDSSSGCTAGGAGLSLLGLLGVALALGRTRPRR